MELEYSSLVASAGLVSTQLTHSLWVIARDHRMTSVHQAEMCQKTTPIQWVADGIRETVHLQIGKYW